MGEIWYFNFFVSLLVFCDRSGCAIRSLELNGQAVQLERSAISRMAFNIVEFRSNARAVSKELFRGSLTDASEALKTLLGRAIEGFYQYNVCKKYDEKQFSSEIYI